LPQAKLDSYVNLIVGASPGCLWPGVLWPRHDLDGAVAVSPRAVAKFTYPN